MSDFNEVQQKLMSTRDGRGTEFGTHLIFLVAYPLYFNYSRSGIRFERL